MTFLIRRAPFASRLWREARLLALALTALALSPCASSPRPIAMDTKPHRGQPWTDECLINRPCEILAAPLPPCPRDIKPVAWPTAATPRHRVPIAGQLKLEHYGASLVECSPDSACCTQESQAAILVGQDGASIRIPNLGCFGDESRRCCNVEARGQRVVATGSLELGDWGAVKRWAFWDEVTLCAR